MRSRGRSPRRRLAAPRSTWCPRGRCRAALYGSVGVGGYDEARHEFHAAAERAAEAAAEDARAAGVDTGVSVPDGHGADALVEASRDADLLVVGSRGHGGFVGLLLGSVSAQCAQYAACPVVIVR